MASDGALTRQWEAIAEAAPRVGPPGPPSLGGERNGGPRWGGRPSLGGRIGVGIVVGLLLVAGLAPMIVGVEPARQDLAGRLAPPLGWGGSLDHPLGTNTLGQDMAARLLAGARVSLLIGAVATLAAGLVGVTLGLLAGYAGGFVDRLITWVVDVQMAMPFVVVAIALAAVLERGLGTVILALALTGWIGYARVVRLQARSLRRMVWVEAARSVGVSPLRLMGRHILPNLLGPILVLASQQVAAMILYEAALSYLGLGVGGDVVTWGGMVADGRDLSLRAWWVPTLPGLAIALTVFGFNLLGDWRGRPYGPPRPPKFGGRTTRRGWPPGSLIPRGAR